MLAACAAHFPPPSGVPIDEWDIPRRIQALLPTEVLLLGEQHDAPEHRALQRAVVQALAARGSLAAVALEMAEQDTSTAGLPPDATEAQARDALKWREASWPWRTYGPVVMAAVQAGVPVLGANLAPAGMARAMNDTALDGHLPAPLRERQRTNLIDGHCGLLPEARIAPMARVQTARDAAMARTVTAARQPGKTVLLIAGNGHVDRALGVPTHLDRALTHQSVVLRPGGAASAAADETPADAVWTTPALPPTDYCAEMRRQMAPGG